MSGGTLATWQPGIKVTTTTTFLQGEITSYRGDCACAQGKLHETTVYLN